MSDGEFYYDTSSGMSNNSQLSYSTPFKPGFRTGTSKTLATEERSHIRIPKIDNDFISTHFTSPTSLSETVTKIKTDSSIKQSLSELDQDLKENPVYGPLANIFNKVASSVCSLEPMVFHPSYDIRPSGENRHEDRVLSPDFSILPPKLRFTYKDKEGKQRIPWSALESVIEVKRGKRWDHPQAIDYIETLLQYRPDKVYALGMSCNQELYQFYYADACVQKSSPEFRWKNSLDEFIQFVHTLHRNYKEDIGRDKSYTLHGVMWQQKLKAVNASAKWRVSFDGRTSEVQRIFARKGKGRRTWLGIGQEINESSSTVANTPEKDRIRIVKDMWRDTSRRFKESEILNQIHKDGYIAGVVRHISAGSVNDLTVADPIKGDRVKERVVMASTGLRLSACESVLDFLKVMYDLVETHEQLLEKRGVLHRDISWFNVLCKPEHFTGHDKVIEHPTIGKILRKEGKEREPLCLLTDFDNASLTRKEENPCGATERTGTPMFMASELSHGLDIYEWSDNVPTITLEQFDLEGDVLDAYLLAYSEERYAQYQGWLQGALSEIREPPSSTFLHLPSHDMESVYWIIVWFIIKSWPTETKLNFGKAAPKEHEYLKNTMLSRGMNLTTTVSLLHYPARRWKISLDPVHEPLVGMLVNMSRYLCIPWSRISNPLPWHSHEVFKRLLLKEIVRMTNENTPIPIQGPRPSPPKFFDKLSTTNGSQIPSQTGISTYGLNASEPQSLGSKKRQSSTPTDSEPPPKKPRRTRTTNGVEENPDPLAKFVHNLANDVWWFV